MRGKDGNSFFHKFIFCGSTIIENISIHTGTKTSPEVPLNIVNLLKQKKDRFAPAFAKDKTAYVNRYRIKQHWWKKRPGYLYRICSSV
ncbi:hypothetical protein A8C56_03420 [Niabella ginsenosidivorans]|uniref:Uncharacterized protein n=1 Tax=Niabella ginsenosidivorans TaxID=1176587 RepID=A0A1A9I0F0_9BACT|nr:hypothetical protein A8C56_03420 [Niabella ginsenosidivorans]